MRLVKKCYTENCENEKTFSVSPRQQEEFEREFSWLCKRCEKEGRG